MGFCPKDPKFNSLLMCQLTFPVDSAGGDVSPTALHAISVDGYFRFCEYLIMWVRAPDHPSYER
jgi:hypothetical protein